VVQVHLVHERNGGTGIRLNRLLRTVAAEIEHQRGRMIRTIVNESGEAVGEANVDGMLIKGHRRIDSELKLHHKLFFITSGATLTRINCITVDHVAHKIRLTVDGFSRDSSPQHTA
jgi:hypothetical protein